MGHISNMSLEQPNTLDQVAAKGREIYERKYRGDYEARFLGKYVAIDVVTETAFMGDTPVEAIQNAKSGNNSDHLLHLIRVGDTTAFQVGFLGRAGSHSHV